LTGKEAAEAVGFIMVFTKDDKLPSIEELTVQEVELGSTYLRAGGCHLGKYCEPENNEFVLCKTETDNPVACLEEGKLVTSCALKFFQSVKKFCAPEFITYAKCLESSSQHLDLAKCRKTQYAFDACVKENMGLERPIYAYSAMAKIHDTDRPKPEEPRPAWLDDPRGAYGRPDYFPGNHPDPGKLPHNTRPGAATGPQHW